MFLEVKLMGKLYEYLIRKRDLLDALLDPANEDAYLVIDGEKSFFLLGQYVDKAERELPKDELEEAIEKRNTEVVYEKLSKYCTDKRLNEDTRAKVVFNGEELCEDIFLEILMDVLSYKQQISTLKEAANKLEGFMF